MRTIFVLTILMVGLTGIGCAPVQAPPQESAEPAYPVDPITFEGTIRYIDLEGGFWAIHADDGARYNPINLPDNFKEDGLRVNLRGKVRPEILNVQQYGVPIEIQTMIKLTEDA